MGNRQEQLNEYEMLKKELNRPIRTLGELATVFCIVMECKNCPVHLENYDKRSVIEKTCLHEPCVSNLYKWIKDKILTEYINRLKDEYDVLKGENQKLCKDIFDRLDNIKEEIVGGK